MDRQFCACSECRAARVPPRSGARGAGRKCSRRTGRAPPTSLRRGLSKKQSRCCESARTFGSLFARAALLVYPPAAGHEELAGSARAEPAAPLRRPCGGGYRIITRICASSASVEAVQCAPTRCYSVLFRYPPAHRAVGTAEPLPRPLPQSGCEQAGKVGPLCYWIPRLPA